MAYAKRVAAAVLGWLLVATALAQTSAEIEWNATVEGCRFATPATPWGIVAVRASWSGECKDGLVSGPGALIIDNATLRGEFAVGSLTRGTLQVNGDTYDGEFKNNTPHGQVTLRTVDGILIRCTFIMGATSGRVVLKGPGAFSYEGDYNHTTRYYEGQGKATYADGSVYAGEWREGLYDGTGVYTLASGEVQSGTFRAGRLEGEGSIRYSNGVRYRGQFQAGAPQGTGIMEYVDGTRYEGQLAAGQFEGRGVLRHASGVTLEAEFKAGVANGKGKEIYANGDVYDGEFVAGVRSGKGTVTRRNGDIDEGDWQAGELNGKCMLKSTDMLYRGDCLAGKKAGRGYFEDLRTSTVYEGEFRDDMASGKGVLKSSKDARYFYEGDFKAGNKDGTGTERFAEGEYQGEFANGAWHGRGRLSTRSAQGQPLLYEGMFVGGKMSGAGTLRVGEVSMRGEFDAGTFVSGAIEAGARRLEVDVRSKTYLEVAPDGSMRPVAEQDVPAYGSDG